MLAVAHCASSLRTSVSAIRPFAPFGLSHGSCALVRAPLAVQALHAVVAPRRGGIRNAGDCRCVFSRTDVPAVARSPWRRQVSSPNAAAICGGGTMPKASAMRANRLKSAAVNVASQSWASSKPAARSAARSASVMAAGSRVSFSA
jgi:hypothetical protein